MSIHSVAALSSIGAAPGPLFSAPLAGSLSSGPRLVPMTRPRRSKKPPRILKRC